MNPKPPPDLARWHTINERIRNPEGDVTIAIVGKYTGMKDAYKSLIEALSHGGIANKVKVNLDWIESEVFENEDPAPFLEHVNGILVPGGFGQRGAEGKIRAAQFARERNVPYFGICFGMQMAVLEAARNLCGIEQANSTEFGPTTEPVVGLMTEWLKGNELQKRAANGDLGGTMRLGAYAAMLTRGSRVAEIYGSDRNFRAPPPPLRGQHRLQRPARAARHALLRHVARRHSARDRRIRGPSLVHRRAIPSRTEIAAVRAASAVRVVHRRGGGAEPAGVAAACCGNLEMPRGLDHIVHAVRDLDAAAEIYRGLGFTVGARNRHPWGTHNHIMQLRGFFIELLTLAEPDKLGDDGFSRLFAAHTRDFLEREKALRYLFWNRAMLASMRRHSAPRISRLPK